MNLPPIVKQQWEHQEAVYFLSLLSFPRFYIFFICCLLPAFSWGQVTMSRGERFPPLGLCLSVYLSLTLTVLPHVTSRQLWFTASIEVWHRAITVLLSELTMDLLYLLILLFPSFFTSPLYGSLEDVTCLKVFLHAICKMFSWIYYSQIWYHCMRPLTMSKSFIKTLCVWILCELPLHWWNYLAGL